MNFTRILIAGLPRRRIDTIATWLHDAGYIVLMAHDLAEAKKLLQSTDFRIAVVGPEACSLPYGKTAVLTVGAILTEKFLLGEIRTELTE